MADKKKEKEEEWEYEVPEEESGPGHDEEFEVSDPEFNEMYLAEAHDHIEEENPGLAALMKRAQESNHGVDEETTEED